MAYPTIDLPATADGLILARSVAGIRSHHSILSRAVSRGELIRIHRGAYVEASTWSAAPPWHRYRLRCRAAALAHPGVVLSHASAAAMWGAPLLTADRRVEVLGSGPRSGRVAGELHYRGSRAPTTRITQVDGVLVTDLPRTLAEFAARASLAEAVVALDWGLHPRGPARVAPTSRNAIRAAAVEVDLVRGAGRLERALAFADGASESAGESLSRVLIAELGFEPPELQHELVLGDGQHVRVDFRWARERIVGEFDGLAKYCSAELRAGRTAEQVVVEEKLREDAIRHRGERVGRWVWADLRAPRRLHAILEALGVPRAAP
ncbi:hypothetical protein OVN20_04790 [Microcella daejeonensis]|uniref:hypothetical protein n=1 Tax=Microcella daejeonensis TaxID=2994971 RepID=UPI00226EB86C|nr:hypothetical protein [Microcella daejeonensis]WAB84881.1 hypothetical protein OVN20_04790 [Microcella daejeonensis]